MPNRGRLQGGTEVTNTKSLLIEIGCEELPIHAVDDLARAFVQGVCDGLSKRGIEADIEPRTHVRTLTSLPGNFIAPSASSLLTVTARRR